MLCKNVCIPLILSMCRLISPSNIQVFKTSSVDGSASDEVNDETGDSRAEMLNNDITPGASDSGSEEDNMLDTGDKP